VPINKKSFHKETVAGDFLFFVKVGPFTKDWISRAVAIHVLSFSD